MRTIVIVGVGALGSHVVQFLRDEDVAIRIVDFDRVEQKNAKSQFHGAPGVGKMKVEALRQSMDFLWKRKLEAVPAKLTGANATQLVRDAVLVIDCLDNAEGRMLLRETVVTCLIRPPHFKRPLLHGALAANGSYAQVAWDEHFHIDEGATGAATCEDGRHLPFIATTAALLARAAQAFLRDDDRRIGWVISPTRIEQI